MEDETITGENLVLAISYVYLASYYILFAIKLIMS